MTAWSQNRWVLFQKPLWPDLTQPGPNNEPALMPLKQFAEERHYTRSYILNAIYVGRIKAIKRGARWWVYPSTWRES